jgi:carboxyl-terminal processing protease
MHDDDKKTQSQWGEPGDTPSGWQPTDYLGAAGSEPATGSSVPEPGSPEPAAEPTSSPATDPAGAQRAGAPGMPDSQTPAPVSPPAPWQSPNAGQQWAPPVPGPWAPQPRPNQWWPQAPSQGQGWQPGQGWPPTPPSNQAGWPPAPSQPQGWPPAPGQGWQPGQPPSWQPGQGWQPQMAGPQIAAGSSLQGQATVRKSRLPQVLSVVAACLISFSAGMATDRLVFGPTTTATPSASTSTNQPLKDFALYEQALQIVRQNFVGKSDVTDEQLLYGSIRGMVDSLGDTGHSVFLTPSEYSASQSELSGNVAGIGVLLSTDNGQFTVTKVLPDSPALAAGVKAGDQITAVDGVSVSGLSFDVFASKIRGKAGTKLTITVARPGVAEPLQISMTRAVVSVPLVTWGMIPGTHVADIALVEFSNGASDQLAAAITSATDSGATAIVFDLRGNPGGYASEAVDVASEFISSGTVYITQDSSGHNTSNEVNTSVEHTSLPMVVLVDHNSASASEIVAGALQDSKRATVVGQSTFGTGTVLQPFKLPDGSAILLGTAYWLTPNGHKIFGKGITPDQQIALAAGVEPLDPSTLAAMTAAQLNSSGDAELLAAVQDLVK